MAPQILRLGVAQSRTLSSLGETIEELETITKRAAASGISILLFPEAYLGGYPRTSSFGAAVGGRSDFGRDQFLKYFQSAVDLGDTPAGAGDDWVDRKLPLPPDSEYRGDGTREKLEKIAADTGVFIVTGLVEKSGGSLYCAAVYVDPVRGCLGKRRKVMPTGSERVIWAQGSASTLKAVTTTLKGVKVTMCCAICWENYMPLLRQSIYYQNVNLYLAPTADQTPTWMPLMQTIGFESRAFVLSANQCQQRKHLPAWIRKGAIQPNSVPTKPPTNSTPTPIPTPKPSLRRKSTITKTEDNHEITWPVVEPETSAPNPSNASDAPANLSGLNSRASSNARPKPSKATSVFSSDSEDNGGPVHEICLPNRTTVKATPDEIPNEQKDAEADEFVTRGGSSIVSPFGKVLAGPLWEIVDGGLLAAEVDFEDCWRGRLDLDVAGHYARRDQFRLSVEGLVLDPPA